MREVWEVKPDKEKYFASGKKQLGNYIKALGGYAGKALGRYRLYYPDTTGIYVIDIRSDKNDGMIYYSYRYDIMKSLGVGVIVMGAVLICTGVGAPEGAATLAYGFRLASAY